MARILVFSAPFLFGGVSVGDFVTPVERLIDRRWPAPGRRRGNPRDPTCLLEHCLGHITEIIGHAVRKYEGVSQEAIQRVFGGANRSSCNFSKA